MDTDSSADLPDRIQQAYSWANGCCFRCSTCSVPTAELGRVGSSMLRACERCIGELERDREQAALRSGIPYVPGSIRVG